MTSIAEKALGHEGSRFDNSRDGRHRAFPPLAWLHCLQLYLIIFQHDTIPLVILLIRAYKTGIPAGKCLAPMMAPLQRYLDTNVDHLCEE